MHTCTLAQSALLSKPRDKSNGVFSIYIQRILTGKYTQRVTSLTCTESIYEKTMETACVSEELEKKMDNVSLGDFRIERVHSCLAMLTVRVVVQPGV